MSTPCDRMRERLEQLGLITEEPGIITRSFLSPAMRQTQDAAASWMVAAGLEVQQDAGGNVIGRTPGFDANAPALALGSHLDTVRNAGRYDGPLGVLAGLAALETLAEQGVSLDYPVELLSFADEEGLRYQTAYLGSSFYAGIFPPAWLDLEDAEGITIRQALIDWGTDPEKITGQMPRSNLFAYLEAHIEQGPVLEAEDCALGVVTAIAGQTRIAASLHGKAGHAGTTPMSLRQDALAGAAAFICEVERVAREGTHLVATVGTCEVIPGASNVIPSQASFSIDIRHPDNAVRQATVEHLEQWLQREAEQRGLEPVWSVKQDTGAIACDERLQACLSNAVQLQQSTSPAMLSGAGHDAVAMSQICPVGMLFVRCRDGLSHHPDEHVSAPDQDACVQALVDTLLHIKP